MTLGAWNHNLRRGVVFSLLAVSQLLFATSAALAYDRLAAVEYISRWWNDRNGDFHDYTNEGGDCANFGSQVLIAGGIRFRPVGTTTVDPFGAIVSANKLRNNMIAVHGATESGSQPSNLAPGDLVFLLDVPCGPDASAWHTLVVKKIVGGVPYVAAHSNNRSGESEDDRLDSPLLAGLDKAYLHIPDSPVADQVQLEQNFQVRYHGFRKFVPTTATVGLRDSSWVVDKDSPLGGGTVKLVAIYDTTIRESPPPTVSFGPSSPFNSASFGNWIASQFRVPRDRWDATADITESVPEGQQTMLNDAFGPDGSRIDSDGSLDAYNPGPDTRVRFRVRPEETQVAPIVSLSFMDGKTSAEFSGEYPFEITTLARAGGFRVIDIGGLQSITMPSVGIGFVSVIPRCVELLGVN